MSLFPAQPLCRGGRLAGHGGPQPLHPRQVPGVGPAARPLIAGRAPFHLVVEAVLLVRSPAGGAQGHPGPHTLPGGTADLGSPRQRPSGEPGRAVGKMQVPPGEGTGNPQSHKPGGDRDPGPLGGTPGQPSRAETWASWLGSLGSPRLNAGTLREPRWAPGVPGGPGGLAERHDPVQGSGGHSPTCAPGRSPRPRAPHLQAGEVPHHTGPGLSATSVGMAARGCVPVPG